MDRPRAAATADAGVPTRPRSSSFFGLLPESISHEGYSAKPVHSYWDDFWALEGPEGRRRTSPRALGREDLRTRWARIRDEFAADLHASIARVRATRGIDFIPGSADLADFDATSTTIALDPAGELGRLPAQALARTFERYWTRSSSAGATARRLGGLHAVRAPQRRRVRAARVAGARARAPRVLPDGRRPAGVERLGGGRSASEPRKVRFVGDIPHAWVGSDFIRSVLDFFACERESDGALVLAAGIPARWLAGGAEVGVRGLRTPHGKLTWSMRREAKTGALRIRVAGGITVPPGGFALRAPLSRGPHRATIGGKPARLVGDELVIRRVPADILVR